MEKPTGPGPGRSTADAAFSELTKHVARCNEEAHKAARKLRTAREKQERAVRREWEGR